MRRIIFLLLAVEFSLASAHSQSRMELKDVSDTGSPVRISGFVSFSDDTSKSMRSYDVEGHFRNVSSKNVLLLLLKFVRSATTGPSLDFTYQQDYFFSTDVLGKSVSQDFVCRGIRFPMQQSTGEQQAETKSAPLATAETVFVQFADGTTWGDREAYFTRFAFLNRKKTGEELGRLEQILDAQGEVALAEAKVDTDLPDINSLKSSCIGKAQSCMADHMRMMIEAANHHRLASQRESNVLIDDLR